ncbi:phosphate ABC transporter permease [Microcoleus sp. FACHB-53]|nr:phosphate ABC transporter permease [Microcoleus sp. FACHB-53]MBD2127037.1 phosphate ABC transporter permease [Microcoleus sp. FACHB-1]
MLVPITRQKFEQIIPILATGPQYGYFWGKFPDFLKRLLISLLSVVGVSLLRVFFGSSFDGLILLLCIVAGLYWLWGPIYWATMRNMEIRRYPYSGFWRGEVVDVYVTEDLIGKEETVNNSGELVIVENRERRLNVEVEDENGFGTRVQVPLRRIHKGIAAGQVAEMLVLSYQPDLRNIVKTTDIYIPSLNRFVSDYPYLQPDVFAQVSQKLSQFEDEEEPVKRGKNKRRRR